MLEEVSRLVARIGSSGSFATRRSATAEDLNLEVQGIGRIRFPVSPATARKLADGRAGRAPPRTKDDWSITMSVRCSCQLCATLTRYLRASDRVRFEWPLAKTQRAHIHGIADSRDLPVRHTTRRTGRPFTLLLEKTAAVFEREATDRRSWQSDLQWLKVTTADF